MGDQPRALLASWSSPSDGPLSQHQPSAPTNTTTITTNEEQQPQQQQLDEIPDGCCPICGIPLFQQVVVPQRRRRRWSLASSPSLLLSSLLVPTTKQRRTTTTTTTTTTKFLPLTVEGSVQQGHCVQCEQVLDGTVTNSSSSSSGGSNSDTVDEEDFVYEGEVNIYGQRHGPGELIWSRGDRYVGNFFNGIRDGEGTLFLRDGSQYSGDWECDEMHGRGTRTFCNGDSYVGDYRNGRRCGQGKYFFANGELYVGGFEDNVFHGLGKYHLLDGQIFQGTWERGLKHGKFKWQHPDSKLDILRFDKDQPVGAGVRWNADRSKTWLLPDASPTTMSSKPKLRSRLLQRATRRRIPIAQAVSIAYDCETGDQGERALATSQAMALPQEHVL